MVEPMHYCFFLQISSLAALCTDQAIKYKFVCKGNNIEVFENITSISLNTEITLYKQLGNKSETLALWVMKDFNYTGIIQDTYKEKVSLENGNILLKDFQSKDEAAYVVLYQKSKRKEVQLCALTPPSLRCKLDIKQEENFLIALLKDPEYCGKPKTSVIWMEHPNISYRSQDIIEVPAGNQPGTYRACIKGETLKCLTDSLKSYYCTNFTTEFKRESRPNCIPAVADNLTYTCTTIADIPQLKNTSAVTVGIVSFLLLIAIVTLSLLILIHYQTLRRRRGREQRNRSRNIADPEASTELV